MNSNKVLPSNEFQVKRESEPNQKSCGTVNLKLDSNEQDNNKFCGKFWRRIPFSGKQLVVILLVCYGNFCVGSAYSLLAPFFPVQVIFKVLSS